MIPKSDFFEWIENYCLEQLSEEKKLEFEDELKNNIELQEELKLQTEIQSAITEVDVTNLREKLRKFSKQQLKTSKEAGTFELLDDFADIEEITNNVSPEELISFYDSLPKVHVYQHGLVSKEHIHEFYKEQLESTQSENEEDALDEFDMDDFSEFEGIEEALIEKDILSLRDTLAQVSKSVKSQYSAEDIDKYINGELTGDELENFETEISQNQSLKEEVELHKEMEFALMEEDILDLRDQLSHIIETETSWNVSAKNIEDFIEGNLEGELLEEFINELNENTDLMAEVNLRKTVNEAIGEKDIIALRKELQDASEEAQTNEVKSIIPNTSVRLIDIWKRGAAVIIILLGIAGVMNYQSGSLDKTYQQFYHSPEWSPERSVTSDLTYLDQANIFYIKGEYTRAIEIYDRAIQSEKQNFVFHFYKGASLQNLNRFEAAIPEYNQVIKQGDNLYIEEAEWNKSLCYVKLGKKDLAKKQLLAIINRNGYYKNDAKAVLRRLKYYK